MKLLKVCRHAIVVADKDGTELEDINETKQRIVDEAKTMPGRAMVHVTETQEIEYELPSEDLKVGLEKVLMLEEGALSSLTLDNETKFTKAVPKFLKANSIEHSDIDKIKLANEVVKVGEAQNPPYFPTWIAPVVAFIERSRLDSSLTEEPLDYTGPEEIVTPS